MNGEYNLHILNFLLKNGGQANGRELSAALSMTENTLRKEISALNDYLADYSCSVISKKASGYSLIVTDRKVAEPFLKRFQYDYRRTLYAEDDHYLSRRITRLLLSSERAVTVEEIAELIGCSRSTVLRKTDAITRSLREYGMSLGRSSEGLFVKGTEWQKRQGLLYAHKMYQHDTDYEEQFQALFTIPDHPDAYEEMRSIFINFISENEYAITYVDIPKIINYLILCITRFRHAKELSFSAEQKGVVSSHKIFKMTQKFVRELPLWIRQRLTENDVLGLAMLMLCYKAVRNVSANSSADFGSMIVLCRDFLAFLSDHYLFSCDYDEILIHTLSDYFYLLKFRLLFEVYMDREIGSAIPRNSVITMELCDLFAQFYEEKFAVKLSRTNIMGTYVIFDRFVSANDLNRFQFKGIIASIYGTSMADHFRARIQKQYRGVFSDLDTLDLVDLFHHSLEGYDILFTDYYSRDRVFPYVMTVPVSFDRTGELPPLDKQFRCIICNRILELFNKDHLHRTALNNQEECLEFLTDHFSDTDSGKKAFRSSILERDSRINRVFRGNKTVFVDGTGLCKDALLEVMVNAWPVSWNGRDVQTVVFYARPDDLSTNQLLNAMLEKLSQIDFSVSDDPETLLFQYQLNEVY